MPGRILARIVLVLFASSLAAAAGCGGGGSSSPDPVPAGPNEKQIKKEAGRIPGSPAPSKPK